MPYKELLDKYDKDALSYEDKDLLICELQTFVDVVMDVNKELSSILEIARDPNHNPTFVANKLMKFKPIKGSTFQELLKRLKQYAHNIREIEYEGETACGIEFAVEVIEKQEFPHWVDEERYNGTR